jgi:hypothetical protein
MLRASLIAVALLAAGPAWALTASENFEGLSPLNTPLASIATGIGTITGLAGAPFPNVFLASAGFTNFGPGNNPTTSVVLTANGDEHFSASLAFAARTVQMDVLLNDFGPATLRFFNGATLLGQINFAASDPNYQTVSFTTGGQFIDRFTFISTNGGTLNTGLDNISITTGVPEPASWAMLIAGFGLVGAVARRRQRTAVA